MKYDTLAQGDVEKTAKFFDISAKVRTRLGGLMQCLDTDLPDAYVLIYLMNRFFDMKSMEPSADEDRAVEMMLHRFNMEEMR